jgi:hypothetical protein
VGPFKKISFDAAKIGGPDAEQLAPAAAVAVGLALRGRGSMIKVTF